MELFFVIFQIFHDFQSLWEPCIECHLLTGSDVHLFGMVGRCWSTTTTFLISSNDGSDGTTSQNGGLYSSTIPVEKRWPMGIVNCAAACDFQQSGILTSVDSEQLVQPHFKHRKSKWCSVSSLTVIEYSSDWQRLWPDCAHAQADLRLYWLHIPHCWKSHVMAQFQIISILTNANNCL